MARKPSDDRATDRSHADNRRECLRDNCIGETQENAQSEAEQPPRDSQVYERDQQANREAIQECAEKSGAFVGKLQRYHHAVGDRAKGGASEQAVRD